MTHTQTVSLILDATRSTGVLFHTLTPAQRTAALKYGRAYMLAHATGRVAERNEAEINLWQNVSKS